ncbi:low molecular weight phosphotyrosine protein phosphatase [Pseudoalteromonas luteoviolacea]|uniref:low molecular weight protein-tyrosine-phosphatase n=1 Tax=Pseudoalteromonas luteoviolacea TaxID=43657 RepID=UPI0031B9CE89|nr:low molecular weight phosphotyrosine protein phosphatase [Pseudoalteromonas luteoviolacea]
MQNILVVCMGNICRSPTMEAVLKAKADVHNLNIEVDSAGTINYHQGNAPDKRSMQAGEKRGYSFANIHSRQVTQNDFAAFDLILCADKQNLSDLKAVCPSEHANKLHLFLEYADAEQQDVPDPYYGQGDGFELVLDLVETASERIVQRLLRS